MSNLKIITLLSLLFIGCLMVNMLPVRGDDEVVIPTRTVPTNSPVPLSREGRRSVNDILRTKWETWDPKHISNPARRSREILALYESFSDHFINIYTGISKSSSDRIDSEISNLRFRLNRNA